MSEDVLASDVDTVTKLITDAAADGVEIIFGTSFKEDLQDEILVTVIAAGFDAPVGVTKIENPLIDSTGNVKNDLFSDDFGDIFNILDNK